MNIAYSKKNLFFDFIRILFVLMMSSTLIILLVVGDKRVFLGQKKNTTLIIIGFILLIFAILFYNKFIKIHIESFSKKQCTWLLFGYFFLTFILQMILLKKIFFLTGWDVEILSNTANSIANGYKLYDNDYGLYYFQTYPNNVFLLFIFAMIMKIAHYINVDAYILISVVGMLLVNIAVILTIKITAILTNNRNCCVLVVLFSTILIMFSPWIVIPYSDTYAIFFTTSIAYLYLNKEKANNYLTLLLISALSIIGYKIKPTVIIVLIAIILIEGWKYVFKKEKRINVQSFSKQLVILISVLIVASIGDSNINKYLGYEKNKDVEIPITHFLMMGMNPETKGVYFEEDVLYTQSMIGIENKKNANITVIKERMNNYGIKGYIKLLVEKTLTNYNDGLFAWEGEGNFYKSINSENDKISLLLKNIYYSSGKYHIYYQTFLQSVWLVILALSLLSVLFKGEKYLVINLTIIGITLFLLLFECRARYLFLYTPYFTVAAALGGECLKNKICTSRKLNLLKSKKS